jgi:signal transduction histidine kinase
VFRHRPEVVRMLSGAFELTTLPNRAELRLKDTDRVIGYTLSVIRNDAADVIGAIMFFKDLTRVEQQEERERLRDRLASLGEMAAGIAHELKNPLAGIEVMAGLLRRQVPDSPDAQSLLADIINEAKLANAIVGQMLEFVRPVRLQMERTDLREVLQQAITLAEAKATRGQTSVRLAAADSLAAIDGDHYQLVQVFTNLLINAFEALEGGGRIELTASTAMLEPDPALLGDSPPPTFVVVIDIADNGPGIPAEARDKIFDPFFTTKVQGSGLGLPIVRKIVDAHEGRIDLVSDPGQGTRFRVTIPVSNASSTLGRQVGKK